MSRLAPALVLAAVAVAATSPASAQQKAQPLRDYEYTFRVENGDERPMTGTMRVSGDRGRIDVDGAKKGEFMLLGDGGRTLTIVHPDRREYEVSDAAAFEQIVGSALRKVGPIVSIKLEAAHVATDHLGDGGRVAGLPTRRLRMTQDFTVRVGALGFGGDAERHVVTTEYWASPGLTLMRNPLLGMIESAQAALVQGDTAYGRVVGGERDALLEGATPLRRVVTAREKNGRTKTQTIEITSLHPWRADASVFEVPRGYERRSGLSWFTTR